MIERTDHQDAARRDGPTEPDRLLVAVDVDGTLLNTEFEDVLRDREIVALAAVREAGHVVALCTGRNTRSMQRLLSMGPGWLGELPLILLNGAMVIGGNPRRRLCHHLLDRRTIRRIVEIFREHQAVAMVYDEDDRGGFLFHEDRAANEILSRYLDKRRRTVGAITAVEDLLLHLPETALEVGTIDRHEVVAAITDQIRRELASQVKVVNTLSLVMGEKYRWAEVYNPASSKGQGVSLLAAENNIPLRNVVGLGDNYNDLDLFATAGYSVAMGNAPADVKDAADRIAPPVAESGAALILEEIAAGSYPTSTS
jgi:Cof subfamily protein (haloacid dehalogenase superfamily)